MKWLKIYHRFPMDKMFKDILKGFIKSLFVFEIKISFSHQSKEGLKSNFDAELKPHVEAIRYKFNYYTAKTINKMGVK